MRINPDELTPEQRKGLISFFAVTFTMDERELDAIDGIIPMTQELFDSIVDKCIGSEFDGFFYDFLLQYPDFLIDHANQVEMELEQMPLPKDWHDPTPEETEASWQRLCARIREEYGEDAI
ncbi:hypothetical protein ACTNEF_01455 [Bariatricus sp. HCP28S3_E4]|uniref:hypothetical protein n=1 Tax=unclassified Bariatricus TaxID=2677046 RepID=UPI003F8A62CA